MSLGAFIPLYAAANDGIYRMNKAKMIIRFIALIVTLGIVFGILLLAVFATYGTHSLVSRSLPASISYPTYWILALIGTLTVVELLAGSVYGLIKLAVKIVGKRFGKIANELEGDLVVSWSQVTTIIVVKVRRIVTVTGEVEGDEPRLVTITIGDWHVFTIDGRDIKIPKVEDPHNKLNYVKNRFNLNF